MQMGEVEDRREGIARRKPIVFTVDDDGRWFSSGLCDPRF